MAVTNFMPSIWSARFLFNLQKSLVFQGGAIVNRNWEGDIRSRGDSVRINMPGPVTVSDYSRNTDLAAPERLTDAQTVLVADQAKSFNFGVDDLDQFQANVNLIDMAMQDAAYRVADKIDQFIAGLYTGAASSNLIGTSAAPKTDLGTEGNAYNYFVDMAVLLDANNVPETGRWAIVPPWLFGIFQKDTKHFSGPINEGVQIVRNRLAGSVAGFDLYKSNNIVVPSGTTYAVMFGTNDAITYADAVAQVVRYRPEKRFEDAVKGLYLYGGKVVRPEALGVAYLQKA